MGGRGAARVVEDLSDHRGLGNEAHDAHRLTAAGAAERVDFEAAAQRLRPTAADAALTVGVPAVAWGK
ncbi:MAG: hypothetical protein GTN78_07035 [Gemmatimonadales bacterium]|nr:hypothetical protein [Gemmatimonadales bacterium]NIQ99944.1 hypothetical protein [Gemmatimonadales bacterium]NIS64403.1 hypothetical protein [Gemmatimonadales bacterium]